MKAIYLTLLQLLDAVPAIRFADLDKGQLEYYTTRPAVAFPCALIKIEITKTEDLGQNIQRCTGRGTVRLAFNYVGETTSVTPELARTQSLQYFDVVEAVYLAVQGKTGGNGKFNRQSCVEENRPDGLKVVNIPFATVWLDKTAAR